MTLGILCRQDEPFSLKIYSENIIKELSSLGIAVEPFGINDNIPDKCDIIWDPGIAGNRPPHNQFKHINKPLVATVHGAAPFVMPLRDICKDFKTRVRCVLQNYRTLKKWKWFKYKLSGVIAVSEFGRDEVCRVFDLPAGIVHVCYHGVDHNIFKPDGDRYKNKPYFLFVGSSDRSIKNMDRVFEAYRRLPEDKRSEMIAIIPGFKKNIKIKGLTVISNSMSQSELARFYRGAQALVFPSLRESFGMPILEAMACACPVITSNRSACSEVAGNAALLVNPYSVEEIANAMRQVLLDEALYNSLRQKGLQRASQFTWRKSAEEHLKIFKNIIYNL